MGRRGQKSRSGQAKDRSKRAVKGSVNESSVVEDDDSEKSEETADKSSNVENTDSKNDDDATEESSAAIDADSLEGDETPADSAANESLNDESADDIAAGYASIEADQSPQTCCPNCKTVFEVSPELLSSKDTRVRCGECLGIFDALANLRHQDDKEGDEFDFRSSDDEMDNDDEQSAVGNSRSASGESTPRNESGADTYTDDTSLDVTYADFSLFSADAALPEVDYLDETREVPAFDFDDPGGDDELDETYSETLFAHGPEVDARSAIHETDAGNAETTESPASEAGEGSEGTLPAEGQAAADDTVGSSSTTGSDAHSGDELDDLVDSLQRPESPIRVEESPVSVWWLRGALGFLVVCLAAGLYGYRERESLQHSRLLRPALETLCSVIGCTLAEPVDLASLQVLKRSVFSHPKLDDVLVINIGFVNKATFNQRFPVLEIRLTDRTGGLVVKNSFEPSDYLDNWQPGDVLDAGKRLDISLNVKDPGNKAMSFELDFR